MSFVKKYHWNWITFDNDNIVIYNEQQAIKCCLCQIKKNNHTEHIGLLARMQLLCVMSEMNNILKCHLSDYRIGEGDDDEEEEESQMWLQNRSPDGSLDLSMCR